MDGPAGKGGSRSKALMEAMDRDFGSVQAFRNQFTEAALKRFESAWARLVVTPDRGLVVT